MDGETRRDRTGAAPARHDPLRRLRSLIATGVAGALGGDPGGLEEYTGPAGDPGLFGPGSFAWTVHADLPAMIIGGISSLMLQTLHPLAMAGVAEHSRYREDPLGRLANTARFVGGTTFGSMPLVDELVERVRHVHGFVTGTAPDGRHYEANDPALLTWVHTTEMWSFLRSYQRYSTRPLLRSEKDAYLAEVARLGRRLGATGVPESVVEVRRYLERVRPELEASDVARDAVAFISRPVNDDPVGLVAHKVIVDAAVDLLPAFARRALRLRRRPLAPPAATRIAAASFAAVVRWAIGPSIVAEISTERARAG